MVALCIKTRIDHALGVHPMPKLRMTMCVHLFYGFLRCGFLESSAFDFGIPRFTILTFAVGGTLISMVVVGFLINATCSVHGVCSATCLQDVLWDWEDVLS